MSFRSSPGLPCWTLAGAMLVLPAIGLSVLVGIAAVSRGALVGFTLLGVLNGIPGLDLECFRGARVLPAE